MPNNQNFGLLTQNCLTESQNHRITESQTHRITQEQELEQKLKALEKDLAYEKLCTKALNTMIDIAEKELKISIRKKSGAKQ